MSRLNNLNKEVSAFLDELNHPFKKEIEQLRIIILSANKSLSENIKWNGPNYVYHDDDCITMRVQPITTKNIQLIFHRGAKVKTQPKEKLIEDNFNLLLWKANDRAIATFKSMDYIDKHKAGLKKIINAWLLAIASK